MRKNIKNLYNLWFWGICFMFSGNIIFALPDKTDNSSKPFHLAQTDAEKKLDYIRHVFCNYGEDSPSNKLARYIEKLPHTKPKLDIVYPNFFTKDFLYDWSKEEKKIIDRDGPSNCIKEEEMCGPDFSMFNCGMDCYEDYYCYRTIEAGENYAIIQMTCGYSRSYLKEVNKEKKWSGYGAFKYKMVKHNNIWLFDGEIYEEEGRG